MHITFGGRLDVKEALKMGVANYHFAQMLKTLNFGGLNFFFFNFEVHLFCD